jgi:DNA polymerase III alpha subunit
MGLLKMDFLGLTTLTILDDAIKLIEQVRGHRRAPHGPSPPERTACRCGR